MAKGSQDQEAPATMLGEMMAADDQTSISARSKVVEGSSKDARGDRDQHLSAVPSPAPAIATMKPRFVVLAIARTTQRYVAVRPDGFAGARFFFYTRFMTGTIRVGIGGWTFEPWRGTFYPEKWPHKRELEYAAAQVTAIEINGTYYSSFKPASFAGWRDTAPDGFVFAVKASRYCTNRKILAEAGESIARFCGQGIVELGDKLGPILWQFMATKRFEPDDFAAFFRLLPAMQDGVALRHAVQVRHESFACPEFVAMARAAGVAIVYADSASYPAIADVTGDLVYVRLESAIEAEPAGYPAAALDGWADAARDWAAGGAPDGLPYVIAESPERRPRDVFVFMINGAKVRAPAAATALIERLSG